jgi:hypothetical protein
MMIASITDCEVLVAGEQTHKAGFTQVYNLEGGMTAWINSGYPTVNGVNLEGVHELVGKALVMT